MKTLGSSFNPKITRKSHFSYLITTLSMMLFAQICLTINVAAQIVKTQNNGAFYTISGNVRSDSAVLADANLILTDLQGNPLNSTTTDTQGNYSLTVIGEFSYSIRVYKDGYNFNPSYQILNNVQSNQTIDFHNGILLCIPAPFGQTGGNFCQNAALTNVSPLENGRIAYEVFGSAFAVDADGMNQAQLPPGGAFPSWSPDGRRVLYNRDPSTDIGFDQEIFVMNADGTSFRQLTANNWNDYRARFSPDGTQIVFDRMVHSSDIGIYKMNADGSNEVRLTPVEVFAIDASFSPDGTKIVYTDGVEIFVMNAADGSLPMQLTFSGTDVYNIEPSWSPDGLHIVFTSNRGGDGNEIWRMTAEGSELVALTGDEFEKRTPVYSPDGTKIAFSRETSAVGYREIYVKQLFGGTAQRLTFTIQQFNAENPSWQKIIGSVDTALNGGVNLNFSNVTNAGNTIATPIAPASAGALPPGFWLIPESVAYDVRTSAQYAGDIEVCFDITSIDDPKLFAELVVFHNEDGLLIDRTSSRDFAMRRLCATVTSLSPFVVAAPLAPSAANVSVTGRVFTPDGRGLRNTAVLMTDSSGTRRWGRTNSFGYYRFNEVPAGQLYIFEIRSKSYQFPAQVVTVTENTSELNFYAMRQ